MVVKVLRPIIERRKEKPSNQDQFRYSTDERAAYEISFEGSFTKLHQQSLTLELSYLLY